MDKVHGVCCERVVNCHAIAKPKSREWHGRCFSLSEATSVFAFNLHATASYNDLRIPVPERTDYTCALSTDARAFEGHGHVEAGGKHIWQDVPWNGQSQSTLIYLPARTAIVLAPVLIAAT